MKPVNISIQSALSRRHFLRGAGVMLGLPLLEAMLPAFAQAAAKPAPPRRFLGICNNLGLLPEKFFPEQDSVGRDYQLSPYLSHLEQHRNEFTVFSGVWHPDVDGGHPADNCFLTAAPHPGSGGFRNTISVDQFMAERIGHLTRFPSLTLGVNVSQGTKSLSWTGGGVLIPCEEKSSEIFKKLFLKGSASEVQAQMRRLALGHSIMDTVADQTRRLQGDIGPRDRERLDQYLTGVRDLEKRLEKTADWEKHPKPVVKEKPPVDPKDPREYMEKVRLMYDMARLAFETDSTRCITLMLDSVNSPAINVEGAEITDGYHSLSHHGKSPAKLKQLESIDVDHMKHLDRLFSELKARPEAGGGTLMDHTMVLYGSNLGNANTHVTTNLPVLFAGGGFRHGQHLAFDRDRNYPLPNLFVSMLQRMSIGADRLAPALAPCAGWSWFSGELMEEQSPWPPPNRAITLTAVALLAIALIIGALGGFYRYRDGQFASEGVATQATVQAKKIEENHDADPRYLLQVAYADETGKPLKAWLALPKATWESLQEQQVVEATYLRNAPDVVRLPTLAPRETGTGQFVLAAVAGLAGLGVFVVGKRKGTQTA